MKVNVRCVAAFLFLGAALANAQQLDSTVATVRLVKTQAITLSGFNREVALYAGTLLPQGRALSDRDRNSILNRMIDILLFKQAAERDRVTVSDAQISAYIAQTLQSLSAQWGRTITLDDLKAQVAARGQAWETWLQSQKDQLLPQAYVRQVKSRELQDIPLPSESDVRYYYETNIQQFVIGKTIEFKHIFSAVDIKRESSQQEAMSRMEGIAQRLDGGESFEELATAESEDRETAARGGYAGFLRMDQTQAKSLGKEFTRAVLDLKEGQVSAVIRSSAGYHIVKVVRIIPARLYGLDEKTAPYYTQTVAEAIRVALLSTNQQQAITEAIERARKELRKAADIRIEEKSLGFPYIEQ